MFNYNSVSEYSSIVYYIQCNSFNTACLSPYNDLSNLLLRPGPNESELSENESGVSRDLASAYVLCLRTFVVPNLWRDEGKSLGKKE